MARHEAPQRLDRATHLPLVSGSRMTVVRNWHICPGCHRPVITLKLHGRPLRKWHADCWTAARLRRWDDDGKDLPAGEIERLIADAEAAQKIARRRTE